MIFDKMVTTESGKAVSIGKLDQEVAIRAGSKQSFYVYAKNKGLYTKGNDNGYNTMFDKDDAIMIKQGITTKKLFEQVKSVDMQYTGEISYYVSASATQVDGGGDNPSPPGPSPPAPTGPTGPTSCGDSTCSVDENPDICPDDCTAQNLNTGTKTSGKTGGQMFTIEATTRDVHVTGFEIIGAKDGDGDVEVYTLVGDYYGKEENAWTNIYDENITTEKNKKVSLGSLKQKVIVSVGSRQSFYIYAKKGMLYEKGDEEGAQFQDDGAVKINQGIGMKKLFQQETGAGKFRGTIKYYV